MSAFPPIDFNVPFDADAISQKDTARFLEYFRDFHNALAEMQKQTSNSIFGIQEKFFPVATNSAGTASVSTYQKQVGIYSRIGNLVWFTIDLNWNNTDVTGTGDLYIEGLPVDSNSGTNAQVVFPVYDADSADGAGMALMEPNSRKLGPVVIGAGSNEAVEQSHDLTISGVYLAEA